MERELLFKWYCKREGESTEYYINFVSEERRQLIATVKTIRLADKLCRELDAETRFKFNLKPANIRRCQMQAAMRCILEVQREIEAIHAADGVPSGYLTKEFNYYQAIIEEYCELNKYKSVGQV